MAFSITDTGNAAFHSIEGGTFYDPAQNITDRIGLSCLKWNIPSTCATWKNGFHDPTWPITKYTAQLGNTGDFNTAGTVTYASGAGCSPFDVSSSCIILGASTPNNICLGGGSFTLPAGTLKITNANLTVQTVGIVYNSVSGVSSNNTFVFNVICKNPSTTARYAISTSAAVTVTFFGTQAQSIACSCTHGYSGQAEALSFASGLTDSQFSITWGALPYIPVGGMAMAVSTNPIGDLSQVVSKELEFSLYWTPTSASTVTVCGSSTGPRTLQCTWGWFLTTNPRTYLTEDPYWTPYNDPNVAVFAVNFLNNAASSTYQQIIYVQNKAGETLAFEDTAGCGGGSAYLCQAHNFPTIGTTGLTNYLLLNFTGASKSGLSGSSQTCTTTYPSRGSDGCSFSILGYGNCAPPGVCEVSQTATVIFPKLPLTSATYYFGLFVGSAQTGSNIKFCYDTGTQCGSQQVWLINGCVSSSMEFDACVPDPINNNGNGVNPVTDSGGFFGSVGRYLSASFGAAAGGAAGFFNSVVQPVLNVGSGIANTLFSGLSTFFTALAIGIQLVLNDIGNALGLGNIGSMLVGFFTGVSSFLGTLFTSAVNFFAVIPNILGSITAIITNFFSASNPFVQFIISFFGWIPNLWAQITAIWNELMRWYIQGTLTIAAIAAIWYIFGMYSVYEDGVDGFISWIEMTSFLLTALPMAAYWFIKETFGWIRHIKQTVDPFG